jgi:chromosome segregation ATPase
MQNSEDAMTSIRSGFRGRELLCVLLTMLALFASTPNHAQQDQEDKRAREALRRLQLQQREFNEEKAKLAEEKASLEKELASKTKELKDLQARIGRVESGSRKTEVGLKAKSMELDRKNAELEALAARFAQEQEKNRGLSAELAKRLEEIGQKDSQGNLLASQVRVQREIVGRQAQMIDACEEKNLALYQVSNELLERYRNKGVLAALKQAEPFTGIAKVRMENLWQEYRDKLDTRKIEKAALAQ